MNPERRLPETGSRRLRSSYRAQALRDYLGLWVQFPAPDVPAVTGFGARIIHRGTAAQSRGPLTAVQDRGLFSGRNS